MKQNRLITGIQFACLINLMACQPPGEPVCQNIESTGSSGPIVTLVEQCPYVSTFAASNPYAELAVIFKANTEQRVLRITNALSISDASNTTIAHQLSIDNITALQDLGISANFGDVGTRIDKSNTRFYVVDGSATDTTVILSVSGVIQDVDVPVVLELLPSVTGDLVHGLYEDEQYEPNDAGVLAYPLSVDETVTASVIAQDDLSQPVAQLMKSNFVIGPQLSWHDTHDYYRFDTEPEACHEIEIQWLSGPPCGNIDKGQYSNYKIVATSEISELSRASGWIGLEYYDCPAFPIQTHYRVGSFFIAFKTIEDEITNYQLTVRTASGC